MHYLIAVDLTEPTQKIVDTLVKCVNKEKDKVWLLHVVAPEPDFVGYDVDTPPIRKAIAKHYHEDMCSLESYEAHIKEQGIDCQSRILQGVTCDTILEKAKEWEIDVLIVGSHGKGLLKEVLLGSVSEEMVRRATLPVLIVPVHKGE